MSRDMYGDIEKDTNVGDILSNKSVLGQKERRNKL